MKPHKSKLQKKKDDPNSGYWMRRADRLFGRLWHEAEPRYCKICGQPAELAHMISCKNYLHRWDPANPFPLCSDHHKWNRALSYHGAPAAFGIWLARHYPEQATYVETHKSIITRKIELPFTFREVVEAMEGIETLGEWESAYIEFCQKYQLVN